MTGRRFNSNADWLPARLNMKRTIITQALPDFQRPKCFGGPHNFRGLNANAGTWCLGSPPQVAATLQILRGELILVNVSSFKARELSYSFHLHASGRGSRLLRRP